jgi:hypothetical protein
MTRGVHRVFTGLIAGVLIFAAADFCLAQTLGARLTSAPSPLGAFPGFPPHSPVSNSDSDALSCATLPGLLPTITNLEYGAFYSFGNNVRSTRLISDYFQPIRLSPDSLAFIETRSEVLNFRQRPSSGSNYRWDQFFGGGLRKIVGTSSFVGVNGFFDMSRLFGTWHSSGGAGLEIAAITPGSGAVDLSFNYYGPLLKKNGILNTVRNHGGGYDIDVGYSHPLLNYAVDLRLKFTAYRFDIGTPLHGWKTGADLTSRCGAFTARYEYGRDEMNGAYHTVGGFVNIGFDSDKLLNFEIPFSYPEAIFNSPRNLRSLLNRRVNRAWHQPSAPLSAGK